MNGLSEYISTPGSLIAVSGLSAEVTDFVASLTVLHAAGYNLDGTKMEKRIGTLNFLNYPAEYYVACEQLVLNYGLNWTEMAPECVVVKWEALTNDVEYMYLAQELSECQHVITLDLRGLYTSEIRRKLNMIQRHLFVNDNCRVVCLLDVEMMGSEVFYREFDLNLVMTRNLKFSLVYQEYIKKESDKFIYWPRNMSTYEKAIRL